MIRCTAFQTSMEAPESPGEGETEPIEASADIDDEMKQALRMSLHGKVLLSSPKLNFSIFRIQSVKIKASSRAIASQRDSY